MTSGSDFLYLFGKIVANARKPCQILVLFHHRVCFGGKLANSARRVTVSANSKRICPLYFEQICNLFKDRGNISIMARHADRPRSIFLHGGGKDAAAVLTLPLPV